MRSKRRAFIVRTKMKFPRVASTIRRLTIVLAITIVVRAQQRFKEVPAIYQEVSAGHDVQLPCKVQDKKGQCIWQKDRKPVGIYPDKYEWFSLRSNDCTLLIRRASLEFDDGFWECQVTSGDFMRQDALTSLPARLLVRGICFSSLVFFVFFLLNICQCLITNKLLYRCSKNLLFTHIYTYSN